MNIKEFVADSLIEIFEGIKEAKGKLGESGSGINPTPMGGIDNLNSHDRFVAFGRKIGTYVDFDLAVTVTEGTQTEGKIGIFAGSVGLGSKGQSEDTNSTVSRVRFQVPISLP